MKMRYVFATPLLMLASRTCLADDVTWIASAWFDVGGGAKAHRWVKGTQPDVKLSTADDFEKARETCQRIANRSADVTGRALGWQSFSMSGLSLQQPFLGIRAAYMPVPPDPPPGREIVAALFVIPGWGGKPAADVKEFPPLKLISFVAQGQMADQGRVKTQWEEGVRPLVNQIAEMRGTSGAGRQTTNFAMFGDSVELQVMLPEEWKQRVTFELRIDKAGADGDAKTDQVILKHLRSGSTLMQSNAKDSKKGGFEGVGMEYYLAAFEVWDRDIPAPSKSVSTSDGEVAVPKDAKVLPEQADTLFIKNKGGFWVFAYKK